MGWFDEQIKERKQRDELDFSEAMEEMASSVSGRKKPGFYSRRRQIKSAIDAIFQYYQIEPQELPDGLDELEEQLEYLCRPCGMMRRRVTLERGWYKHASGAMLGRMKDGNIVALLPNRFFGYSIWDKSGGTPLRINAKTQELLEKDAICFYKPLPLGKISIQSLLHDLFTGTSAVSYGYLILASLLTAAAGLLTPYAVRMLFGQVISSSSLRVLCAIAILSLCAAIGTRMFKALQSMIAERICMQANIEVQAGMMARILSLPTHFFRPYSSGELSNRIQKFNAMCSALMSVVLTAGVTALFSLIYVFQIYCYTPSLAVACLAVSAVSLLHSAVYAAVRAEQERKTIAISGQKDGMTYSMLTGIQKIKLTGAEKRVFARWLRIYTREVKSIYGIPGVLLLGDVIGKAISLAGTIVLYFLAIRSGVSAADYLAFAAAYGMVTSAFGALSSAVVKASTIRPALEMIRPILQAVPETAADRQIVSRLSGGIELSSVSFRYADSMPLVLDHLSLKIRPGQYVALVGKSGCGKSTLLRLLLGFEKPQKGAIYYDRKDISALDLKSLRQHIGTVMQNGKLLQGSIFSNITFSAPWLTQEDAWRAAELAGIAEDIRSMPMGMNTIISEGNGGISGGQRQRLLIARAIAAKPRILILDEATSALDNITQKKISQLLEEMKCTRIVVAHRLSTIQKCDRIIVLDDGRIVEDGTYDELMKKEGFFAELVRRQTI